MAASDPNPPFDRPTPGTSDCLTPQAARECLQEEISRAERHDTQLSCLLVVVENLEALAHEHGGGLREQTIDYLAATLRRELRRFDRVGRLEHDADHDLLVILPGADGPRGEIVARRALERLRTIKVEAAGTRQPLQISVGLAAWRRDASADDLLAHVRAASRSDVDGLGGEQLSPAFGRAAGA